VLVWDREGILAPDDERLSPAKADLARRTNTACVRGELPDALVGADVFIGVSRPDIVTRDDVARMAPRPLVFALSNPDPEIVPELIADLAGVIATGRSDYPNQINNVLAFPGVFRGALDAGATTITEGMKLAAAQAIAAAVGDDLRPDRIVPEALDRSIAPLVAEAVAGAARAEGVVR